MSGLKIGESCSYRVSTTCGYPRVNFSISGAHSNSDFDILYGLGEWNDTGDLSPTSYKKAYFAQEDTSSDNGQNVNNKWLGFIKGEDIEAYEYCNGTMRNLYVTVTRTKLTQVDMQNPIVQESRMLQSSQEKAYLYFAVY